MNTVTTFNCEAVFCVSLARLVKRFQTTRFQSTNFKFDFFQGTNFLTTRFSKKLKNKLYQTAISLSNISSAS